MLRKVFVTTSVYALAHQLGMQEALDEVSRQLQVRKFATEATPELRTLLPVVHTITRIARFVGEVGLHVDGGATILGMARSRAFHEAYQSGMPAWITIDDDVEASTATVAGMLEVLDDLKPRIVLTPYKLRSPGSERLAVNVPTVRVERNVKGGIKVVAMQPGHGGGLGFCGMNRPAMEEIADGPPNWVDEDGVHKRALFFERLEDGIWWSEDVSFFRWSVPSTVSVELLLAGQIMHAGMPLELTSL